MKKINRSYSQFVLDITFKAENTTSNQNIKTNILYSKGQSDYTLLVLPQGVRNTEYIKKAYQVFPKYFNVILLDPPGLGQSESIRKHTNINNISKIILNLFENKQLIKKTGKPISINKTILIGKSLFSPIIENVLNYQDDFYATVITAGPIIFSRALAYLLRIHFWLGSKFYLVRVLSYKIIKLLNSHTNIKVSYYDWRKADYWYNWVSIFTRRIKEDYTSHSTPTTLILNGHDELVPESNIKLAKKIFKNLTIHKLPTKSHWGPICDKEYETLHKTLLSLKTEAIK